MFAAAVFTIDKKWKQSRYLSIDSWVIKVWYVYTMCYYSAINNSKVVKFSMGIAEDNHPGLEKPDSQNQKDKYL